MPVFCCMSLKLLSIEDSNPGALEAHMISEAFLYFWTSSDSTSEDRSASHTGDKLILVERQIAHVRPEPLDKLWLTMKLCIRLMANVTNCNKNTALENAHCLELFNMRKNNHSLRWQVSSCGYKQKHYLFLVFMYYRYICYLLSAVLKWYKTFPTK